MLLAYMFFFFFFFFKQKTAYEMRISDWSSDVCSSDLPHDNRARTDAADDRIAAQGNARDLFRMEESDRHALSGTGRDRLFRFGALDAGCRGAGHRRGIYERPPYRRCARPATHPPDRFRCRTPLHVLVRLPFAPPRPPCGPWLPLLFFGLQNMKQ